MMNVAEEDEQFYARLLHILHYHRILLRDEARNILFYEALKRYVSANTRVLDIGSGSGIWAITAAKLGAKKVTAIEADAVMIPVIQAHARENGVADKIEIIHGNSQEIKLPHKFEIIISETIGNQAFDENIVGTMIDARKRFLARGGVIIPQKLALVAAPAHMKNDSELPLGVPLQTDYIKNLALNLTSIVTDKSALGLLGKAVKLLEVDLREVTEEPNFTNLCGRWNLEEVSKANVVALWAQTELADGINLDTWDTINWSPVVCRFKPFALEAGELQLNLNFNAKQYHWTLRTDGDEKPQSYTPFFAYAKLKFDSRFTPKKRKSRQQKPSAQ